MVTSLIPGRSNGSVSDRSTYALPGRPHVGRRLGVGGGSSDANPISLFEERIIGGYRKSWISKIPLVFRAQNLRRFWDAREGGAQGARRAGWTALEEERADLLDLYVALESYAHKRACIDLTAEADARLDGDYNAHEAAKPQSRSPCCIGVSAADVFLESLLSRSTTRRSARHSSYFILFFEISSAVRASISPQRPMRAWMATTTPMKRQTQDGQTPIWVRRGQRTSCSDHQY